MSNSTAKQSRVRSICHTAFIAGLVSLSPGVFGASNRLIDQNGQPVSDAWIVATRTECIGLGHCNTHCVDVMVTTTDKNGTYDFLSSFRSLDEYHVTAYREGYLPDHKQAGRRLELSMIRGAEDPRFSKMDSVSGRLAYLAKTADEMFCFMASTNRRADLLPVYKAMFKEAESMASLSEHHNVARNICYEMYRLTENYWNSAETPEAENVRRERYLKGVEPACVVPLNDGNEREISLAVEQNNLPQIRIAALAGFDFNRRLDGHQPLILVAARRGHAEAIAALLEGGAKADEVGTEGRTALDEVVLSYVGPRDRRVALVKALLEGGADPNRPDIWGYPPLVRIAHHSGDVELFELLLKHGARIDQSVTCHCTEQGANVLYLATEPAMVESAIKHGADASAQRPTAILNVRRPEIMRLLLDNGADPNADIVGRTAPMTALQFYETSNGIDRKRMSEVAEMLVGAGARLDTRNDQGFDAFHYTKDEELKERLRALAAKRQAIGPSRNE